MHQSQDASTRNISSNIKDSNHTVTKEISSETKKNTLLGDTEAQQETDAPAEENLEEVQSIQDSNPELAEIIYSEGHHFTWKRVIFTAMSFASLFITNAIFGSKTQPSGFDDW